MEKGNGTGRCTARERTKYLKIYTGTDIIEVARIKKAIDENKGFRDRVFTEEEQRYCDSRNRGMYESFAVRFAAKEAASKALGCGIGPQCGLKECEIRNDPNTGAPRIHFTGNAKKRLEDLGITSVSVSLSHIESLATATVTMIGKD